MPASISTQSLAFYGSALVHTVIVIALLITLTLNDLVHTPTYYGYSNSISYIGAFRACTMPAGTSIASPSGCSWLTGLGKAARAFDAFRAFLVIGMAVALVNAVLTIIRAIKQCRISVSTMPSKQYHRAVIGLSASTSVVLTTSLACFLAYFPPPSYTSSYGKSFDFLCTAFALSVIMVVYESLSYWKLVARNGPAISGVSSDSGQYGQQQAGVPLMQYDAYGNPLQGMPMYAQPAVSYGYQAPPPQPMYAPPPQQAPMLPNPFASRNPWQPMAQ